MKAWQINYRTEYTADKLQYQPKEYILISTKNNSYVYNSTSLIWLNCFHGTSFLQHCWHDITAMVTERQKSEALFEAQFTVS